MRAEVYRPDAPDAVLATAVWTDGRAELQDVDASVEGLDGLLRKTAVVVPGPFPPQLGASGESVLQPGSPEWFRAALVDRAGSLALAVRFVDEDLRNGWDPASNYRRFEVQGRRLATESGER